MHLELLLLILESILLIATIALLAFSLKEGRGRDKLIMEVSKATRALTRHEYFLTVVDAMMDAKSEVLACITGRMPEGDDNKRTRELVLQIEKLVGSGVKVRYLLPKFPDRLHIGWLYTNAGAEVLYSPRAHARDFRYTVVDQATVLIGVPEDVGDNGATKRGYRLGSPSLAALLVQDFNGCQRTVSFTEYLHETIEQTGAAPEALAKEIHVSASEIRRILSP